MLQVLYLLRKMSRKTVDAVPALRSVLVTSCETSAGLQLCDRLAAVGFRVFAGHKPDIRPDAFESSDHSPPSGPSSVACALLRSRVKQRESAAADVERAPGGIVFVPLDVTREDSLHEAVVTIKRHLPAGEDGQYITLMPADLNWDLSICVGTWNENNEYCENIVLRGSDVKNGLLNNYTIEVTLVGMSGLEDLYW